MLGIRPGTYRLRFEKEGFYTFEKEVSWRAGTPAPIAEATLTAAPPPPPPPPAAERRSRRQAGLRARPAGRQAVERVDVPDYIERNHISNKEPQKENLIGCSGGAQSWLWQVREPWQNRQHESAELMLYVVGGEGTLALNGRDVQVAAGTLGGGPARHHLRVDAARPGPAIILATLSGPPCAQ